jgi:hypothetical protein
VTAAYNAPCGYWRRYFSRPSVGTDSAIAFPATTIAPRSRSYSAASTRVFEGSVRRLSARTTWITLTLTISRVKRTSTLIATRRSGAFTA